MSKQLKRLFLLLEISAAAALVTGCPSQLWEAESPPYAITTPVYRIAGPDDLCTLGGVFLDFYNKSEKEVVFIETCMNVFNRKTGELAFEGAGGMLSESICLLQSHERKSLCIPLDEFIWQLDSPSFIVDNFFITRIEYSDGTTWQDKVGVYTSKYGEEA